MELRSLDQALISCGCADHRVNGLGICRARAIRCRGCFGPRTRRRWKPRVRRSHHSWRPMARCRTLRRPYRRPAAFGHRCRSAGAAAASGIAPSRTLAGRCAAAGGTHRGSRAVRGRSRGRHADHRPAAPSAAAVLTRGHAAIQAIAATELLRLLHGVARVLVVCPASLKGEWQEQIARFSGATTLLVTGSRPARLAQSGAANRARLAQEPDAYDIDVINMVTEDSIEHAMLVCLDECRLFRRVQLARPLSACGVPCRGGAAEQSARTGSGIDAAFSCDPRTDRAGRAWQRLGDPGFQLVLLVHRQPTGAPAASGEVS